jgi:aldehyde dehydrogenase (NAD+)
MSASHAQLITPTGQQIKVPTGIFINNEFRPACKGDTLDTVYPATGEVLCSVARGSKQDVDQAVAAARQAYKTVWGRKVTPQTRTAALYRWGELMEKHAEELGALEALDNGKPRWMATTMDVADAAACFKYYAGLADKIEGRTMELDDSNKFAFTRVEPIGVCGCIIPWNYPIMMMAWKLGPALAAGNTVVLKPAEQTPLSALRLAELSVEAGFPPGVINIVNGLGPDVGAAIAEHPDIDKVAFTGSTVTGRKVMEAAAKTNLKKVTLELGGKSPVLVFNDVDMDKAIPWVALALLFNMGQDCTAGSRLFVQSGIHDAFVARLVEAFKQHVVGDPFSDDTFQGPQITRAQQQKILAYIESGKQQGAKVEVGGGTWQGEGSDDRFANGFFVEPTIFSGCKKGMKIVDEEIFGPVLAVAKFDSEEEAIALANDTLYGLGAGVFSSDAARCMRVSAAIQAGTVWVNSYALLSNAVPFGGMKQSGYGRELGIEAVREYTQTKAVHLNINETLEWPLKG